MEENNKIIIKKIKENLGIIIIYLIYFNILSLCHIKNAQKSFFNITQYISLLILAVSIIIFEVAYKKDSDRIAINGIEVLIVAFHSLTIWHVINKYSISFSVYIIISAVVFSAYYILKSMIIYTKERKEYLDSLSDIHEIVSNNPIKKEAKKRKK